VKILVILSRVPYPLEKGDKLRAYHHLRLLSQRHEVVVVALADEPIHPDARSQLMRFCSECHVIHLPWISRLINLVAASFRGIPFSSGYFYWKSAQREIEDIIERYRPDKIY